MKDYLAYTLMKDFGVDAPLCSFADITVNGEEWGLYLAVESIEEAFLRRNYGRREQKLFQNSANYDVKVSEDSLKEPFLQQVKVSPTTVHHLLIHQN